MTVKPLKGTLQIHAVVPLGDGKIAARETSFHFMIEGKNSFKWPSTADTACLDPRGGNSVFRP
jgi:hypothetical protein